jgi:hypothetical protein
MQRQMSLLPLILTRSLTRILVFVDESGMPWDKELIFTGAAIWCVPVPREGYQSVLRFTLDRLRFVARQRTGKLPPEIKYSAGLRRCSREIMDEVLSSSSKDHSIRKTETPWSGPPLGCTMSVSMPVAERHMSMDSDFNNILRARALLSLLRPLAVRRGSRALEVSVITDAEVWRRSFGYLSSILSLAAAKKVRLDFSCESSRRVPGLQIADVVAGICRDYHLHGECEEEYGLVRRAMIDRIS